MKRRIFWSIAGVAAVAVVLFGVPLAIAADRLYHSQQFADLQRRAAQAANATPETGLYGDTPIKLPDVDDDFHLALYDSEGVLVVGRGPATGGREVAAERLGQGDFTVRLRRYGLADIDTVAQAMDRTATRLSDLIERERSFSSAASHQLNTPLTTMRLALEGALLSPSSDRDTSIREAVGELERLQQTVEGLLALTRADVRASAPSDPAALCQDAAQRWRGPLEAVGRSLVLDIEPALGTVRCSEHALRETLQVLLDNAARHGRGMVTLRARHAGSGVVIEVEDEGEGFDVDPEALLARSEPRNGHGIGLTLARRLIETQGGRLVIRRSSPRPVFMVAAPGMEADDFREPARPSQAARVAPK